MHTFVYDIFSFLSCMLFSFLFLMGFFHIDIIFNCFMRLPSADLSCENLHKIMLLFEAFSVILLKKINMCNLFFILLFDTIYSFLVKLNKSN